MNAHGGRSYDVPGGHIATIARVKYFLFWRKHARGSQLKLAPFAVAQGFTARAHAHRAELRLRLALCCGRLAILPPHNVRNSEHLQKLGR